MATLPNLTAHEQLALRHKIRGLKIKVAEPETDELRRKFRTLWDITFGTGKRGYWICAAVTHDGRPCISPSV